MKNLLLFIVFLVLGNTLLAQGLSSKRLTTFYNVDYHGSSFGLLAVLVGNENADTFGYYNFKDDEEKAALRSIINLRHSLNVSYAVNRMITVGMQLGFSRDSYGAATLIIDNFEIPFTANYSCFSTEADIKFFKVRKGAIAPLGIYFALRAGISSVKTNVKISELVAPDSENLETDDVNFNAPSLAIVFGKQFILHKKIMMNVGMEFKHTFITEDERQSIYTESVFSFSKESPKTRTYWNDFIRLTIGIGLAPI